MFKQVKHLLNRSEVEPSLVGVGNLTAGAVGGIFWLLLASIVEVSDYGILNYYISISTILSTFSVLGLNVTVMTFLPKGEEKLKHQSNMLVLVTNVLIVIPLLALTQNVFLALLILGTSFFTMTISEVLGRKSYSKFPVHVIGQRIAQFALSIALYYVLGINGILLGYGLALIAFSYNYVRDLIDSRKRSLSAIKPDSISHEIRNNNISTFSMSAIKAKSKFISHAFSTSLAQSLTSNVDKLIITPLFGFSVLGLYQLGFQFLIFLAVIPISLTQYLLPQESSGIVRKGVRKVGLSLAIVFALLFYFGIEVVVNWLFPAYVESIPAARIMILGIVPMTLTAIINARLLGTGRSRPTLIGSIIYLLSLFSLMYLLGNAYHLLGLAIALLTALCLQAAVLSLLSRIGTKRSITQFRS
jgi:O-antigen/teichoic acid export membrane protein